MSTPTCFVTVSRVAYPRSRSSPFESSFDIARHPSAQQSNLVRTTVPSSRTALSVHLSRLVSFSITGAPLIIVAAAIVGTIGLRLFVRRKFLRRCIPQLTDQDLDSIPGMPPNVRVAPPTGLSDEDRETIEEAFLPGSDSRWVVRDEHSNAYLSDHTNEAASKIRAITWHMMEGFLRFAEKYAHVLILTENPRGSSDPGEFLGYVSVLPPYPSNFLYKLQYFSVVMSMGKPPYLEGRGGLKWIIDSYRQIVQNNHRSVLDSTQHWYLMNVAVAKAAQRIGIGRQLVQAAIALTRRSADPMYLECHDQNVPFFEKLGFKLVGRYQFEVKGEAPNDGQAHYYYNSMILWRRPQIY